MRLSDLALGMAELVAGTVILIFHEHMKQPRVSLVLGWLFVAVGSAMVGVQIFRALLLPPQ